jgi:hypothetical protein
MPPRMTPPLLEHSSLGSSSLDLTNDNKKEFASQMIPFIGTNFVVCSYY